MVLITENREVAGGIYCLTLQDAPGGKAGQFVMLRCPGVLHPFLPRPISLFDYEESGKTLRLLYQVVGVGTKLLSEMKSGQSLELEGPYGNGFPMAEGDATLIGGGMGIAPMLLLLKQLRETRPARNIRVHLGYREKPFCIQEFEKYTDMIYVNTGGFVTEDVDFTRPGAYYACGPEPMLRAAHEKACAAQACTGQGKAGGLYVSLEKRMACGVGACYGCSVQTSGGQKRVCKDGPVFLSSEVYAHA